MFLTFIIAIAVETHLHVVFRHFVCFMSLIQGHITYRNLTLTRPQARQRAKKVLSDSPGLVDFAIRLVNSVFNLPDGQVMFYEEFE